MSHAGMQGWIAPLYTGAHTHKPADPSIQTDMKQGHKNPELGYKEPKFGYKSLNHSEHTKGTPPCTGSRVYISVLGECI